MGALIPQALESLVLPLYLVTKGPSRKPSHPCTTPLLPVVPSTLITLLGLCLVSCSRLHFCCCVLECFLPIISTRPPTPTPPCNLSTHMHAHTLTPHHSPTIRHLECMFSPRLLMRMYGARGGSPAWFTGPGFSLAQVCTKP